MGQDCRIPRRRRLKGWRLLIGVGIIGVLLAVVLPVLWRAERRAIVAACPIVYVGEDRRIHLTNLTGTLDLEMAGPPVEGWVRATSTPPTWSPGGTRIAYMSDPPDDHTPADIIVVEPMSGREWRNRCTDWFAGWADDDSFLECHVGFRDARSGLLLQRVPMEGFHVRQVFPLLHGGDGGWIGIGGISGDGVHVRGRDFSEGRTICQLRGAVVPRVDPRGEWVGWTCELPDRMPDLKQRRGRVIMIKLLKEPSSVPARVLGEQFEEAVLCDWTEDGEILANVLEKVPVPGRAWGRPWALVVLDREGKMLHRIPTDVAPLRQSGASWRKSGAR